MPAATAPVSPPDPAFAARDSAWPDEAAGLKNLHQLIQLRWIAVVGQVLTIMVVDQGLGIAIPVRPMLIVLSALVIFNVLSLLRWQTGRRVTPWELLVGLLVDVAALTGQLYLSGGATNPFVHLYLLQVILGTVLLPAWATTALVVVNTACFAALAEWAPPLALPLDFERGLASPYVIGMLLCFALNAALLVTFIGRIVGNLRERDLRLAALRQRAAEEEHIVRMGLLASGAAHELGTPLATLDVILGDWQHLPQFRADAELAQDVDEMQSQVRRCKSIVSGILLSAGETRGESSRATTVHRFLDEVVAQWQQRRSHKGLVVDNRFGPDLPMVSDSTLKQMMVNVLDNALEASRSAGREAVHLEVARTDDALVLAVRDLGPGFAPPMLQQIGKPYQSTKGRPGGGLGLFLVVNVARRLGGHVVARNLEAGGAEVRITLPLAAITLDDDDGGHAS